MDREDTRMEANLKLRKNDGELISNPTLYRKLVGSLLYLTITRPNISYAVMTNPRHLHFAAVKRILQYINDTPDRGLQLPANSSLQLSAYTDANWARCLDTRRSTTCWFVFFGDSLISWKLKKQKRVSKSSTEVEYRAMSAACSEIT